MDLKIVIKLFLLTLIMQLSGMEGKLDKVDHPLVERLKAIERGETEAIKTKNTKKLDELLKKKLPIVRPIVIPTRSASAGLLVTPRGIKPVKKKKKSPGRKKFPKKKGKSPRTLEVGGCVTPRGKKKLSRTGSKLKFSQPEEKIEERIPEEYFCAQYVGDLDLLYRASNESLNPKRKKSSKKKGKSPRKKGGSRKKSTKKWKSPRTMLEEGFVVTPRGKRQSPRKKGGSPRKKDKLPKKDGSLPRDIEEARMLKATDSKRNLSESTKKPFIELASVRAYVRDDKRDLKQIVPMLKAAKELGDYQLVRALLDIADRNQIDLPVNLMENVCNFLHRVNVELTNEFITRLNYYIPRLHLVLAGLRYYCACKPADVQLMTKLVEVKHLVIELSERKYEIRKKKRGK